MQYGYSAAAMLVVVLSVNARIAVAHVSSTATGGSCAPLARADMADKTREKQLESEEDKITFMKSLLI